MASDTFVVLPTTAAPSSLMTSRYGSGMSRSFACAKARYTFSTGTNASP